MNNDINKKAYQQAEKELLKKRIEEIKGYILTTLENIEKEKKEKARIEERLRILKLDLEDLRKGNFDKIKERQEKSKVAKEVSVPLNKYFLSKGYRSTISNPLEGYRSTISNPFVWDDNTCGTYQLSNGNLYYF